MTVQELFNHAHKLGFLDDEVDEVVSYVKFLGSDEQCRGTCGICANRKTEFCPWPQSAKLMSPICCSYQKKLPDPEIVLTPEEVNRLGKHLCDMQDIFMPGIPTVSLKGPLKPGMLTYRNKKGKNRKR